GEDPTRSGVRPRPPPARCWPKGSAGGPAGGSERRARARRGAAMRRWSIVVGLVAAALALGALVASLEPPEGASNPLAARARDIISAAKPSRRTAAPSPTAASAPPATATARPTFTAQPTATP